MHQSFMATENESINKELFYALIKQSVAKVSDHDNGFNISGLDCKKAVTCGEGANQYLLLVSKGAVSL